MHYCYSSHQLNEQCFDSFPVLFLCDQQAHILIAIKKSTVIGHLQIYDIVIPYLGYGIESVRTVYTVRNGMAPDMLKSFPVAIHQVDAH